MAAGISTYKTFLMVKNGSAYEKVVDITSFPDMGGEPEMLETTSLSDGMQTFIPGIQSLDSLSFEANYTPANFAAVKALNDGADHDFAVYFGATGEMGSLTPDGSQGKFTFSGQISAFVSGGGVNEVVGMTITIAPSTIITYSAS